MAIPEGQLIPPDAEVVTEQQTSRTYRIDWEKGRIVGFVDGLESVKQAVYLILHTERYEHLIYSTNYGSELKGLIGKDPLFVQSEIKRRVREALMQDDRIEDVTNFDFQFNEDTVTVRFTVVTTFGSFTEVTEVTEIV